MKIATNIARTLPGLIFVVFGLNAFFNFIPMPVPKGDAYVSCFHTLSIQWE